jgi:hypothetical protein
MTGVQLSNQRRARQQALLVCIAIADVKVDTPPSELAFSAARDFESISKSSLPQEPADAFSHHDLFRTQLTPSTAYSPSTRGYGRQS